MLAKLLQNHSIVLGSNSPRRKQYLQELGLEFSVRASDIDESYPQELTKAEITDYIALQKSLAIELQSDREILITSDTTVWNQGESLGKPVDRQQAIEMLESMVDKTHLVISSVCLRSTKKQKVFNVTTKVHFGMLSTQQIEFYIDTYKPFDKAGGYGIQEWIGLVGIQSIEGSYPNIVGLPTYELVQELTHFISN